MILNDIIESKEKFSHAALDTVLADLCELVVQGQKDDPEINGRVAAAVLDPRGRLATGVNYLQDNQRVHAERVAIDNYESAYGQLPRGSIIITTLSPCSQDTHDNRHGASCSDLLNSKHVKMAYCGYKDPTQEERNRFTVVVSSNGKINELCKKFADTFLGNESKEVTKLQKTTYNIEKIEEQFGPIIYKNDQRHFGLTQLQIKNKSLFEHCMSIGYDRGFNVFCDIVDSKEYADCSKPLLTENIDPSDQNLIKIFDRFNSFNTSNFTVGDYVYYIELSAVEGIANNSKNIYIEHTTDSLEIVDINQDYVTFENGLTYPDKFMQQTKRWSQMVMFANDVKMNSCLATLLLYQNKLGDWTLNSPEKIDKNSTVGNINS